MKLTKKAWEEIGKVAGWNLDPMGKPQEKQPVRNWFRGYLPYTEVPQGIKVPQGCPKCGAGLDNIFWHDQRLVSKSEIKSIWKCYKCEHDWEET